MCVVTNMRSKARAATESGNAPSQALSKSRYRSRTLSNSAKQLRSRMVAAMLARRFDQRSFLALWSSLTLVWWRLALLMEVEGENIAGAEVEGAEGLGSDIAGTEKSYSTRRLKISYQR